MLFNHLIIGLVWAVVFGGLGLYISGAKRREAAEGAALGAFSARSVAWCSRSCRWATRGRKRSRFTSDRRWATRSNAKDFSRWAPIVIAVIVIGGALAIVQASFPH